MFTRIVVGTDGSDTASEAVKQAAELAQVAGASLHVVSAFNTGAQNAGGEDRRERPADVPTTESSRERVSFALDSATSIAKGAGADDVQAHAQEGDPADAIIDVAEQVGADLIVVGNKGMTGARRFLLGSVPNKVSHHAPCSVIIVRTS